MGRHVTQNVLGTIAAVAQTVWENPSVPPPGMAMSLGQLLAHLAGLEWIIQGHPGHEEKLLETLHLHYAHAC